MSRSRTIIGDDERLDNVHPGVVLREDFLIGGALSLAEVAEASGISVERLQRVLDGTDSINASLDVRLARYFGMSEGCLLGLQNDFDLEEVWRNEGAELDRIQLRAA